MAPREEVRTVAMLNGKWVPESFIWLGSPEEFIAENYFEFVEAEIFANEFAIKKEEK